MDFNSLGKGSPFYLLRKNGDHPQLYVGTVKDRTAPQPKYQAQAVPTAFNGTSIQQVMNVTATIEGKEEVFVDIPCNVEVAARGNDTFSGSREAMLQAVDAMIQTSRKNLEMVNYHKAVLEEGEKMIEILNPRYAEEKKRDKSIIELERRQAATDKKLSTLETQNGEILAILRQLNGTPKNESANS